MVESFDAIIIGTGQAGPSLAARLAKEGWRICIMERLRFGGTCVNNGCTPTKALVANARVAHVVKDAARFGVRLNGSIAIDMQTVKDRKDQLVKESSQGVEKHLRNLKNCTVVKGHAAFVDPHTVEVNGETFSAEKFFINVGGRALVPPSIGLEEAPFLTNSSIMELNSVPGHLLILGGGYISLEFGQIFHRLGSRVTILQRGPHLMPKEDTDISEAIRSILEKEGLEIATEATDFRVLSGQEGKIEAEVVHQGQKKKLSGTHLLIAVGRIPNTSDLGLEKAGVEKDSRGFIKVDEKLQTTQSHIWALGDCNGKGAFTHTSYNDYEIVADNLLDQGDRKVSDRIPIYALFMDPPLGRVGMTEKEVRQRNIPALIGKMEMSRVARAREKGETDGFMKLLIDKESKRILGAALLGVECDEVVHMIADVMYVKAPYTVIQKAVHIHPTVSELIPTLLGDLHPL